MNKTQSLFSDKTKIAFSLSLISLSLLVASLSSSNPHYSAKAATETGWVVTQVAKGMGAIGSMTLYITPSGMRSSDPKDGINIFTRGPAWNVAIFSDKTRRVFVSPLQQWLNSYTKTSITAGRFEGAAWKRGGQGTVSGVRAYEFVLANVDRVKVDARSLASHTHGKKAPKIQAASLWVAADIVTPPQVSGILSKLYGVPDSQRIPLRLIITEFGKRPEIAVDTVRIQQVGIPDGYFAIPPNYQRVRSDKEIFIDKKSMDSIDEVLRELDEPSPRNAVRRR